MSNTADGHSLVLPGSSVYSVSRASRLASDIGAKEVRGIWIHYVCLSRSLDQHESRVLQQLLEYGDQESREDRAWLMLHDAVARNGEPKDDLTQIYYIYPRLGTISPWSSQATAVAHVCGLERSVKRIERGMAVAVTWGNQLQQSQRIEKPPWADKIHDRMTQLLSPTSPTPCVLFAQHEPTPATQIDVMGSNPREALQSANRSFGLALDANEIEYLLKSYTEVLQRSPTDVELFMFAQVNSEHCRHKQFNADWTIDGMRKAKSLFGMIKNTHQQHPEHVVSAYSDNAAVFEGDKGSFWAPDYSTGIWRHSEETVHFLGKVETHNHPTAVSPYPGAATGSGGEIRDEGAVGRGSRPKAGLCGFNVSDLLIPDFRRPWESDVGKPAHIASSLDIMLEAPLGSAYFNNEFGRPCITGYFRTLLTEVPFEAGQKELRGYHKPIMIAGGVGTVRPQHALKDKGLVQEGAHLLVLGGPAMLIGLGGGAASSVQSGEGNVELDFASVQRGNAEVQRRAQEVINACAAMGARNPIRFIHDVGAGGLSNAMPELVHDAGLGAKFELRQIDNADEGMSPLQIWCCEAQERYVLAVAKEDLEVFKRIARRERCGFSDVGIATGGETRSEKRLVLMDRDSSECPKPIDLPMSVLFPKDPVRMSRIVDSQPLHLPAFDPSLSTYLPSQSMDGLLEEAINRVLTLPSVGSKSFLITIGDRTVGGLTVRDQMVGLWQVPVADCSVTATSLSKGIRTGEAMAMGERPTLALINAAASARMAVAESLMNLAAADCLGGLERIRLSANWMVASNHPGEGAKLYEAVEAIGMDLCPRLGVSIPVGKDSMSMKMKWTDGESGRAREVTAPLSVVISAFAPVRNISSTWTPALRRHEDVGETLLLYVDLTDGHRALGGSALAQVFGQVGDECPDVRESQVDLVKDYYAALEQLHNEDIVLAHHDVSDGGIITTLVEMMFAGRCGLDVMLDSLSTSHAPTSLIPALFNEELGAVFQVRKKHETAFKSCFATCGPPPGMIKTIGRVPPLKSGQKLTLMHNATRLYSASRSALQRAWSLTSHHIQRIRDNPSCADIELANIADDFDPGLSYNLKFDVKENILPWSLPSFMRNKPRVAVLREQGVNGHAEMAFAFSIAGFSPVDVHMTDLLSGRVSLQSFVGLAACGGFSYGDVLGAGQGWAKSVLLHKEVRQQFRDFFERKDTFTLGVCNGCQFLSRLKELIPGTECWPTFQRNISEQYEARVCMVRIEDGPSPSGDTPPSVFLHGMHDSALPIVVAHGEGRATFPSNPGDPASVQSLRESGQVSLRYVDNNLNVTERYPYNPNGSPAGIAGVRSADGRVLALMPHPERTILRDVHSWAPLEGVSLEKEWGDFGPWSRLFMSARRWVG